MDNILLIDFIIQILKIINFSKTNFKMQNEYYQNTMANDFSSNPENNNPKAANGIIRDDQYWNELHSYCDSVHREIDNQQYVQTSSQAVIEQQIEEEIYGHSQQEL